MRMLLLVSAVSLLVHVAVVSPRHVHKPDVVQLSLYSIYDLANKCSESQTKVRELFDFFFFKSIPLTVVLFYNYQKNYCNLF